MNVRGQLVALLAATLLSGCPRADEGTTPSPATAGSITPPTPTAPMTATPAPNATVVPEVDRSCRVAADCAVKNVGNCCGYFPACVNKDSPTFPDLVAKQCAEQGVAGICGFQEIKSCACTEGRCVASDAETM